MSLLRLTFFVVVGIAIIDCYTNAELSQNNIENGIIKITDDNHINVESRIIKRNKRSAKQNNGFKEIPVPSKRRSNKKQAGKRNGRKGLKVRRDRIKRVAAKKSVKRKARKGAGNKGFKRKYRKRHGKKAGKKKSRRNAKKGGKRKVRRRWRKKKSKKRGKSTSQAPEITTITMVPESANPIKKPTSNPTENTTMKTMTNTIEDKTTITTTTRATG